MGNPKRSVLRSSDTVPKRRSLTREDRSKKKREKKLAEKKVISEFDKNIREQAVGNSDETDKLFKVPLKSKIKEGIMPNKDIVKNILKKENEESIENSISHLGDILKVSDNKVSKGFPKLKSDVDITEVLNSGSSTKVEVGVEDTCVDDINGYNYGKVKCENLLVKFISKKGIDIVLNLEDPDCLYGRCANKSRIFYVIKEHPLFNKVMAEFDGCLEMIYIKEGSLNSLIFKAALEKLYNIQEDYYFSVEPCFSVRSTKYNANIVLLDIILDYSNTAYYVLLEIVGRYGVKVENMILINVDIIFSS